MGFIQRATTIGRIAAKTAVGIFQPDSLTQAWGMLAGIVPGAAGAPPVRGTQEYLRAYAQMPWLRAVAERISTTTAAIEWQAFVVRAPEPGAKAKRLPVVQHAGLPQRRALMKGLDDDGELEQLASHPILTLLNGGNELMTGQSLRQVTQVHLDLVGESFWLKERNALGTVTAVWPVPPNWILALPTPRYRFFRVGFRGWHGVIPDTEFTYFSHLDPANPYGRGTGIGQALGDELETDEYASKHLKAFFYNRARPDLIVWPKDGNARQPEVDRLEQDWVSRTQGFWRCHDEATEALTLRGWVRGIDLRPDDQVATWNEQAGRLEYQVPQARHRYRHDGTMNHWRGGHVDALVTPNHRMWIGRGDDWQFCESAALAERGGPICWREAGPVETPDEATVEIPGVPWSRVGRPPHGLDDPLTFEAEDIAPIVGFIASEGSVEPSRVRIYQTGQNARKRRVVEAIGASTAILAGSVSCDVSADDLDHEWTVAHKGFAVWAAEHVGVGCANKHLPEASFGWPRAARERLLDALVLGDGQWSDETQRSGTFWTTSQRLADDTQRLAVELGYRSRMLAAVATTPAGPTPHWRVSINKSPIRWLQKRNRLRANSGWMDEVEYHGDVWCLTVANGTLLTRRNGSVLVSGNSFKPYFMTREVGIKELDQNFRQLTLVPLREFERNAIMQTFGIPPEIMGVLANCFDEATECLTREGWKAGRDVALTDEIATWNRSAERLEYQRPSDIIRQPYCGVMHHWSKADGAKRGRVDVCVTPNHRMLDADRANQWRMIESGCLAQERGWHLWRMTAGGYSGSVAFVVVPPHVAGRGRKWESPSDPETLSVDLFAPFLGYYLAEGWTSKHGQVCLCQSDDGAMGSPPQGLAAAMVEALSRLCLAPRRYERVREQPNGRRGWEFFITHNGLSAWLDEHVGKGAGQKRFPREVFEWTASAQRALVNAMVDGDGSIAARNGSAVYATISRGLADDLLQLCVQLGIPAHIAPRVPRGSYAPGKTPHTVYVVAMRAEQNRGLGPSEYAAVGPYLGSPWMREVAYDGEVWCVTVPNGAFVTRRNGLVAIHGNSNRSTIDTADYLMASYVTVPRMEFQRSIIQRFLAPEYDDRLIVDYPSPVREDMASRLATASAAPWVLSANEWRRLLQAAELDPDQGGNLHAVPTNVNLQSLSDEPEIETPAPLPGTSNPGVPAPIAEPPAAGKAWRADLRVAARTAAAVGDRDLAAVLTRGLAAVPDTWPAATILAAHQEPDIAQALVRTWRAHAAGLDLAAVAHACGPHAVIGDLVALLAPADLAAAQTAVLQPKFLRAVRQGIVLGAEPLRAAGVQIRGAARAPKRPGSRALAKAGLELNLAAINDEAVQWARDHAADLVDAPAAVRARLRALVVQSQADGISPANLARLIRDVVGLDDARASAVVNFATKLVEGGVADATAATRTAAYAGAQQRARAMTIARTECLPAETVIHGAVIGAVVRRWYDGPIIEIRTAHGRQVSATPNHPMLTQRGWLAARDVFHGDYLVCDARQQDARAPGHGDVATAPAAIGEIFRALDDVGVRERHRGSDDEFHGDGRETQVDVLRPAGLLPVGRFAALYQPLIQQVLAGADQSRAPYCLSCGRLLAVDQQACLCDIARLDPALAQDAVNRALGHREGPANSFGAAAGRVASDDLIRRKVTSHVMHDSAAREELATGVLERASRNAALAEHLGDPARVCSELRRHEIDAAPALVELDRVENVSFRSWSGHVFNLSTPYGYFTANGVYTGNTIAATNGGQQMAWNQAVAVGAIQADAFRKEWITTDDEALCEDCEANGAADPVEIDGTFDSGDDAPPAHPLCRCAMGLVNAPTD